MRTKRTNQDFEVQSTKLSYRLLKYKRKWGENVEQQREEIMY